MSKKSVAIVIAASAGVGLLIGVIGGMALATRLGRDSTQISNG